MIPLWFHKNKYDSRWKCKRVATPTLFLSGTGDQLVPPKMMTELFNTCGSDTKLLAKFPGGSHNETWNCRHYLNTIQVRDYVLSSIRHVLSRLQKKLNLNEQKQTQNSTTRKNLENLCVLSLASIVN